MISPTRDDLARLLWSDPASGEWLADARAALKPAGGEGPQDSIEFVLTELVPSDLEEARAVDGEPVAEDLRRFARAGKRAAVLCLMAAFEAERCAATEGS